jgi:hypothetical protein
MSAHQQNQRSPAQIATDTIIKLLDRIERLEDIAVQFCEMTCELEYRLDVAQAWIERHDGTAQQTQSRDQQTPKNALDTKGDFSPFSVKKLDGSIDPDAWSAALLRNLRGRE